MQQQANKFKVQRLGEIVEQLLMVSSGINVTETTLVFDAERSIKQTYKEVEHQLPLFRRSQALEVLWAISFKGDDFKRRIIGLGALDILVKILEEFRAFAAQAEEEEKRTMFKQALSCVCSLAMNEENADAMIRVRMTEYCVDLLSEVNYTYIWPIALETLVNISRGSKVERKKMQGSLAVVERIIGSKRVSAWDHDGHAGYLQSGTEPSTQIALALVENLMTREESRIHIMEKTRAPILFRDILNLENVETKACLCRIIARLCNTQVCREQLKTLGLEQLICDAFISATNGYAQAATGVALAALVSSTDEQTARLAAPFAIGIINASTKRDSADFRQITVPAVLHVLRALSRQKIVQDMVVEKKLLSQLVNLIRDELSSPIAIEHACHVLGSVALQPRWNEMIRGFIDTLPGLMMVMKKAAVPTARAAAARALQHLSTAGDVRFLSAIADYKNITLDKTGSSAADVWTGLGAIMKLVQEGMPHECWEHGAGLLRNMMVMEEIREKAMMDPTASESAIARLCAIIGGGNILAKMHAAAALGNVSNNDDRKAKVIRQGGKLLMSLIKLDKDPAAPPGDLAFLDVLPVPAQHSMLPPCDFFT